MSKSRICRQSTEAATSKTKALFYGTAVDAPYSRQFQSSMRDVLRGLLYPQVWGLGAIRSVTNAYRKTILGPWWIPLSTLFFVLCLSNLRVALGGSGANWRESIAFVSTGLVAFNLVAGAVNSCVWIFASSAGVQVTSAIPLSTSLYRAVAASLIDFAHELIVILVILVCLGIRVSVSWWLILPGIATIAIFQLGLLLWLGPLVCRYRDVGPIIAMVQRVAIFLTPIFWSIDQVGLTGQIHLAKWNPYTYFVSTIRDPLLSLSHEVSHLSNPFLISLILATSNLAVGLLVYGYSHSRLSYWASTP